MKSLIVLWSKIADDFAIRCCTSATFDLNTVKVRAEHEGFSFLTITLPRFGKDFEKSLDQGRVSRDLFQGFTWRAGLPVFLQGFLENVFDRNSGLLVDSPNIDAINAIRQLTLFMAKISLPCSDTRIRNAMTRFVDCEQEVRRFDQSLSSADKADFSRISQMLFSSAFTDMDRKVFDGEAVPKHGPGATADKLRGNGKYLQSTWPARLEKYFPCGDFLLPNHRFYDELDAVNLLEPGSEIPVKVISVPKTLKTPRIIGIEPTAMQYAQQSILPILNAGVASDSNLCQMIGRDDQTPNQELALAGSLHGQLATLDLSDASDRVSNQLVRLLFANHPHLHGAIDSCRTRKADVPGHGVIRLAKFASMGSALCFPIEAMVFTTMIFIGIERSLKRPLRKKDINDLSSKVRTYGDDIIVPVEHVHSVVRALTTFGSKVNLDKSFWTGRFRESCGKEYYAGEDVSIVRVREIFPTQPRHARGVISTVSLRNQLYKAGFWGTCQWLDDEIRSVIRYFPVVLPTSRVLGRHSFLGYETQKIGKHLHNPLVRGYVVHSPIPSDPLDGSGALLKFLLKRGSLPTADRRHLERAGRPRSVNIKAGMFSAV